MGENGLKGLYKPRSGKVNQNAKYFSEEQYNKIKKECRELINYFGYSKT